MNRFTLILLLLASHFLWQNAIAQSDQRPNIIFIITDDQQVGLLGIEGNPTAHTPNIDRIGKEGMLFKNAFVTTPLCSPSRASFFTGNYSSKHLVINNDKIGLDAISHTLNTWPRRLRETGYETAFIGKWHMGLDDSRRPGFDRWMSFKGQGDYVDGVINDEGLRKQTTGYMTDIINDHAVEFLQRAHDKPFAMIVAHKAVHWPIIPAKRHEGLYSDVKFEIPTPPKGDLEGKQVLSSKFERKPVYALENVMPEMPESRRGRSNTPLNIFADEHRCMQSVDDGVGLMLKELEAMGELDNTLIIYVSDNGMLMGEHGQFNKKRWAYDPVLRIPMLMRYPKLIDAGSTREQMVQNIDVAPTILELAGVEPIEPMQGTSLLPILKDEKAPWRESMLHEYFFEKVVVHVRPWQAVRTEEWKYIHYTEGTFDDELYHLANDPEEIHNLASDKKYKKQLAIMKAELLRLTMKEDVRSGKVK